MSHPSSPSGLRVLWLTTSAATDGPGRALTAVLNHWPAGDVHVVCALRAVTDSFRAECRGDVQLTAIGMRGPWDVPAFARLRRICQQVRPDVIHTHLSRADWVGRLLGRVTGVPVLSTIHNVHSRMYAAEFPAVTAWVGALLDRVTMPLASRIVAVSNGVGRDLEAQGVPARRIVVIHNAFDTAGRTPCARSDDTRRALGATPDDVVIGSVALMKAQKGLADLVDAAVMVVARNERVRFVHMGDGPDRVAIERRIAAAGLGERFLLLGHIAEPMNLLPSFDAFVLPSLWEGLPVALLEAMAAGLPAVGTRVSGIEDVIEDGETGLLVPASDPHALAAAVGRLAADRELRQRLGEAARRRLERFRPSGIAAAHRALHLEVLARPAVSGDPLDAHRASNVR